MDSSLIYEVDSIAIWIMTAPNVLASQQYVRGCDSIGWCKMLEHKNIKTIFYSTVTNTV